MSTPAAAHRFVTCSRHAFEATDVAAADDTGTALDGTAWGGGPVAGLVAGAISVLRGSVVTARPLLVARSPPQPASSASWQATARAPSTAGTAKSRLDRGSLVSRMRPSSDGTEAGTSSGRRIRPRRVTHIRLETSQGRSQSQPSADCAGSQFGPVGDAELGEDVGEVGADGAS